MKANYGEMSTEKCMAFRNRHKHDRHTGVFCFWMNSANLARPRGDAPADGRQDRHYIAYLNELRVLLQLPSENYIFR